MKKFYSLAAAVLAVMGVQAATPTLTFQGSPVEPGKTYVTGWTLEKQDLPPGLTFYNYTQNSDLCLTGPEGEEVTIQVKASDVVQVCSITGQCAASAEVVRTGFLGEVESEIVAREGDDVTIDLRIDKLTPDMSGADPATLLKDITVEVTAYYTETPAEKVTATVILSNVSAEELGGIGAVEADASDIKVIGNVISYDFTSPCAVAIYNVNGALVMKRTLAGRGTLSLDALRPGVYVYTAGARAGKVLIRK